MFSNNINQNLQNTSIIRVVILGAIASIGMIASQVYWLYTTWNLNEREFEQKVAYALHSVANTLAEVNGAELPPRKIVNKRTGNYYVVNVEYEIAPNLLEDRLLTEFEKLALYIDFEYAVYDCTSDEMVYGQYIKYSPESDRTIKPSDLPKSNEFTYYFGVKFPTRPAYLILGKMQLSVIFSILLLFTILFFVYAMYTILKQKRLSEMQKDFINNMTHEFKTPISTIGISADVFLNNPMVKKDQRLFQYAGILKEQNQRLNNQVEKVLQLARIDREGLKLKKEELDLVPIIKTVAHSVDIRIEKLNGQLSIHPSQSSVKIIADPFHLTNTLHNLLDNAIKYCNQIPQIEVFIEKSAKYVTIKVKDLGMGISKENLNKVFDKFYRIPTGNVHNVKGFGLGLYYVKEVANAHGWQVDIQSEINVGTTVIISIPS